MALDGFEPRPYPDIVRDLLTTLTGGTVRESAVVPPGDVIELRLLADRPLRRVSHLQGVFELPRRAEDGGQESVEIPYRFTDADFELIATGAAGDELDAIRFRKTGRRPPIGSTVTVNYYPTQTLPAPVTDLNVGSVARTLLESVARELAVEELLLENVYRSAFLETAEGSSLDKVVALVGITRRPAGVATTQLRFFRAPNSSGRITIPVASVVADADGNRYATTAPLILEPGEPSRQVIAAGVSRSTPAVDAGALSSLEVLIAGIASVANERPAAPAAAAESDDDLRRRARGALAVAARGTLDALRFGLLSLDGVKDVAITEFPNGVPGEIAVDIAYERDGDAALEALVAERLEDLRPAGIRVTSAAAASLEVAIEAKLTLAGSGVTGSELTTLQEDLEARVSDAISALAPSAAIRQAPLVLVALDDARIVDASFTFSVGGAPAPTLTPPAGSVPRARRPFTFDIDSEEAGGGGAQILLDAIAPIHVVAGVTAAEAQSALETAADSWGRGLRGGDAITVDAFLAAVRDDSRYQLIREDSAITVESEGRFLQLADGVGSHPVASGDVVDLRAVHIDIREGGV